MHKQACVNVVASCYPPARVAFEVGFDTWKDAHGKTQATSLDAELHVQDGSRAVYMWGISPKELRKMAAALEKFAKMAEDMEARRKEAKGGK